MSTLLRKTVPRLSPFDRCIVYFDQAKQAAEQAKNLTTDFERRCHEQTDSSGAEQCDSIH